MYNIQHCARPLGPPGWIGYRVGRVRPLTRGRVWVEALGGVGAGLGLGVRLCWVVLGVFGSVG